MLTLLSALLAWLACVCLACSQKKHAQAIFGQASHRPPASICQRWAWGFLLLSLLCTWVSDSIDFFIILWPMFFGMGALIAALILAYRPGWLRPLRLLPGLRARRPEPAVDQHRPHP